MSYQEIIDPTAPVWRIEFTNLLICLAFRAHPTLYSQSSEPLVNMISDQYQKVSRGNKTLTAYLSGLREFAFEHYYNADASDSDRRAASALEYFDDLSEGRYDLFKMKRKNGWASP